MTFSSKTDFFFFSFGGGFLVTVLLLFCAVPSVATGGSFIDSRDGKKYRTVKIGTQTWMAENLNFAATGSFCYANDSTNCKKYGRLYNWDAAMVACPVGWHLPSENEWEILVQNTGYSAAGKNLKDSLPFWNGTNKFGFSALPGGRRDADGSFDSVGTTGRWWTATKNGNFARNRNMNSKYESAHWSDDTKDIGLSVRCVQDISSFFIDSRDGKKYRAVKINNQTWMAENLNFEVGNDSSWCYKNDSTNCVKYGRLYNWATAMAGASSSNAVPSGVQGVCPTGWHLPSNAEWSALVKYVDFNWKSSIDNVAGTKLKAKDGWNGTDDFDFSALPGGSRDKEGGFYNVGIYTGWWAATDSGSNAFSQNMISESNAYESVITKALGLSVRCVQDTGSFFIDPRDNKKYRTVKIDTQTWMAENLNFNAASSVCYNNDSTYCNTYGRLYNWATAMTACPAGWHLPSDAEWNVLTSFVGTDAGTKLKSVSGWSTSSGYKAGTDDYGFSTLPGGSGGSDDNFDHVGNNGYWWSASEYNASNAWYRNMGYHITYVNRNNFNKNYLFSVRCLKDL
jgi:uncharacterized protein (TIGR02145 family)